MRLFQSLPLTHITHTHIYKKSLKIKAATFKIEIPISGKLSP